MFGANLVILAQICDECGQGKVYGWTDGQTDRRTDRQTERRKQRQYPFDLKGQGVKIHRSPSPITFSSQLPSLTIYLLQQVTFPNQLPTSANYLLQPATFSNQLPSQPATFSSQLSSRACYLSWPFIHLPSPAHDDVIKWKHFSR